MIIERDCVIFILRDSLLVLGINLSTVTDSQPIPIIPLVKVTLDSTMRKTFTFTG